MMCCTQSPLISLSIFSFSTPMIYFAGSRGKGFIVLFMKNIVTTTKNIYVTSETGVQMNISTSQNLDPTLKAQIDRMVDIPSNQLVVIPTAMELNSFQKERKAIFIESSHDVFVISHDDGHATTGSTTHIPLHQLSTKYVVISTEPVSSWKSQLAVAAIEDTTYISITFKMRQNLPIYISGNTFFNNDIFNVTLDRFETYQIAHDTDLTGTVIESSSPIAAFSGNDCNKLENIGACDHLIEQLPSTTSIDNTYIVPPNTNDRDTLVRIIALEKCNITYVTGAQNQTVSLGQYEYFETKISSNQTCFVESPNPIIVTSIGLASKSSTLGDPSMTNVPGFNQYLNYYKIVVPTGYDINYVSIMIVKSSQNSFQINGTMINIDDIIFEADVFVGHTTYNVRSINVTEGELTASTVNGEQFGLMFSGISYYEAYGFSGNSLLLDQK